MIETEAGDGSFVRIVYRNGGTVDAFELDKLCEKVGWPRRPIHKVEAALKHSFMVSTLIMETGTKNGSAWKCNTQRLIGLARCAFFPAYVCFFPS